jgi:hypothetical protein
MGSGEKIYKSISEKLIEPVQVASIDAKTSEPVRVIS